MGVCYSPYHQQGGPEPGYTEADVEADMAIIAKYFYRIRTYTVQFANIFDAKTKKRMGTSQLGNMQSGPGPKTAMLTVSAVEI